VFMVPGSVGCRTRCLCSEHKRVDYSHTASEGRGKCPDTGTSELNGATWRDIISSATGRFREIRRPVGGAGQVVADSRVERDRQPAGDHAPSGRTDRSFSA